MNSREKKRIANSLLYPWLFENCINITILLCALIVIAYCIWTLDRGFEITDESYYILMAMHAGSVKFFISAEQWITAGFWRISGSIAMFRAIGLVILLTSSSLLALGVFSVCSSFGVIDSRLRSTVLIIASSIVTSLLYATTINLSPCYNLLISAGAYIAGGSILLASSRSNTALKYSLFTIAGCAVGIEVLCKLSAGLATFTLLIFWVAIFERSRYDKIFGSAAVLIGIVMFVSLLLLINSTISDTLQAFIQGMQLFRMVQVETIVSRLIRYAVEYGKFSFIVIRVFFIPIVAMIAYVKTHRLIFAQIGLVVLVVTLLFGSLETGIPTFSLHNTFSDSFIFGGYNRYDIQIVALFAILIIAFILSIPVWNKNSNTLILFTGLFILPYSVAIGTGNMLFSQVIDSLAPWGVIIAVFILAQQSKNLFRIPVSLVGLCFIATITLQIVTSGMRPYQLSSSLTKQSQKFNIANFGEIKVDSETYKFLADMQKAAKKCNITPGTPFLGLYDIPGVSIVLQTIPVSIPWLNNNAQAKFVIEHARPTELRFAIIALKKNNIGEFPKLLPQLKTLNFGYQYCGMATYPFAQQRIYVWKSKT